MFRHSAYTLIVLLAFCTAGIPAVAAAASGTSGTVLSQSSLLRTCTVWTPAVLGTADAPEEPRGYGWDKFIPSPPLPAGWVAPDFDDSAWVREAHPLDADTDGYFIYLTEVAVRGAFFVADPARVKGLRLSLGYRGGAVVYLNGKEIARRNLPAGALTPSTLAEDYAEELYDGKGERLLREWQLPVPVDELRTGRNVLAVEIHRSTFRSVGRRPGKFATAGLYALALTVSPQDSASETPPAGPVQLWNADAVAEVDDDWYGEPGAPLRPIRLVAPRNGAASGQVVLGGEQPLARVAATASTLRQTDGKGVIPAQAVSVCYGARTSLLPGDTSPMESRLYDVISPEPVAGSMRLPVWVIVTVPDNTPPGEYAGTLTVKANGLRAIAVPVALTVAQWQAPAPNANPIHVGLMETPECLARRYGVPLWSEAHWALIEQSLKLLGQVGADPVYIPLILNTHLGNTQTMVRWVKQGDAYAPDYRVMERYLDLWLKYVGQPEYVCLYVWDFHLGGQRGSIGNVNRENPMGEETPVPVTEFDPRTGEVRTLDSPPYGEPGSETFWQPVMDGIKQRLTRRGIPENAIILGHGADARPNRKQLAFWTKVAPYARWVLRSHTPTPDICGTPVAYASSPCWRIPERYGAAPRGPVTPGYTLYAFPRDYHRGDTRLSVGNTSPPFTYRRLAEGPVLASGMVPSGFAGVGVDFWDQEIYKGFLGWGHLGVRCAATYLLVPGPYGPLSTVRFEMLREGLQEAAAAKTLIDALTTPELRSTLGDSLATRCGRILNSRCWVMDAAGRHQELFQNWRWQERAQELYAAAADVEAAATVARTAVGCRPPDSRATLPPRSAL